MNMKINVIILLIFQAGLGIVAIAFGIAGGISLNQVYYYAERNQVVKSANESVIRIKEKGTLTNAISKQETAPVIAAFLWQNNMMSNYLRMIGFLFAYIILLGSGLTINAYILSKRFSKIACPAGGH